jgi:hypothetical protein
MVNFPSGGRQHPPRAAELVKPLARRLTALPVADPVPFASAKPATIEASAVETTTAANSLIQCFIEPS